MINFLLLFHYLQSVSSVFITLPSLHLYQFSSVTQSCPTLRLREPQHARPPCPSPTPRVYSNSCPLSRWYHPAISSCHPLLLLPSIYPSIRVFSNESALRIRWPKYWSFSFNVSPSNEHPGLISFRMDWLDLLADQGTQESSPTPQYHSFTKPYFEILSTTNLSLPCPNFYLYDSLFGSLITASVAAVSPK